MPSFPPEWRLSAGDAQIPIACCGRDAALHASIHVLALDPQAKRTSSKLLRRTGRDYRTRLDATIGCELY
jgi:hypothetical protein